MAETPARRWLQFRLRTMLVGVVLIGAACSYAVHESRLVEARRDWLKNHPRIPSVSWEEAEIDRRAPSVPLLRRVLGDKGYAYIFVRSAAEAKTVRELFPEAATNIPPKPD